MGNDIAETLSTLIIQNTNEWMPKLKGSKADDEETRLLENAQNQIEYKTLLDEAVKKERTNTMRIRIKHMHFYGKNAVEQCRTK